MHLLLEDQVVIYTFARVVHVFELLQFLYYTNCILYKTMQPLTQILCCVCLIRATLMLLLGSYTCTGYRAVSEDSESNIAEEGFKVRK